MYPIATDAIITLSELHCAKESDGTGHSEPYLWPVLVWIDGNLVVRASAPALGNARVGIKQDMRSGETAAIPASVGGVLRLRLDESVIVRGMFLVAALWENDESPSDAVRAGFLAFKDELRDAVADNLLGLSEEVSQDATIAIINTRVRDRVTSAIKSALTVGEKARVFAGTLNLDDIVGSDFKNLSDVASTPITLTFAGDTGGRLLRYQDASQTGGGEVSNPQVIGQAGWQGFTFLFSGGNGVIYAVDPQGRLLRYQDASQTGGGDVSNPQVIGQAGWQGFTFLFSGGNGVIYAVDPQGRLLRYQDASQTGGGDVSNPQVIGQAGWQGFTFLFSGGNGVIYAVDPQGRLLRYQDASQTGGGDVSNPQVIGQAGWQGFTFLFSGGNGVIYAVDPQGRLLRYQDASQTGGGDVSNPQVIGQAGWQGFTFLFSGGNGVIYAVDEFKTASEAYEVRGELRVGPVAIDRCQAQVDRLNAAQEAVASVEAQIQELQTTLSTASPGDKPSLIAEITRLQREDLRAAKANVDDARRALQACRSAG